MFGLGLKNVISIFVFMLKIKILGRHTSISTILQYSGNNYIYLNVL